MSDRGAPLCVRSAHPTDAEALTAIARAAKASWGYPAHWLEAWADELSFSPADLRDGEVVVAEAAGRAVGVAAIVPDPEPELAHLWVHPDVQRAGVGRALLHDVVARARAHGWRTLRIESDPNAVSFYERMGAVRVGRVAAPLPDAPERHLPVLRLALDAAPTTGDGGARSARADESPPRGRRPRST